MKIFVSSLESSQRNLLGPKENPLCYHSVIFLAATTNIIGNLKPTLRLEASLLPVQRGLSPISVQRGLSPISFSISTMARFYENKEYEMVSSAEKDIYWAWSHKED